MEKIIRRREYFMKKIFKFFISVIIIAVLFIIANLIWTNYLKPVEIPELSSISNEYGTTIQSEEITKVYEIYSQKIDSDEFINLDVNSYIDKLIEDFKNSNSKIESIAPKDKAVLKNVKLVWVIKPSSFPKASINK